MKTNKPKKYQYTCQLIDAWLDNKLPESGGHYTGSSTYLECSSDCFWAGRDHALLLAVKNRKNPAKPAILIRPVADIPFAGTVCDANRMVAASFTETRKVRFLIPPSQRKDRWNCYRHETRPANRVPTLFVPHLAEWMRDSEIESLHTLVLPYYEKAFQAHFSRKDGTTERLLGYWAWKWDAKDRHAPVTDRVRKTFNALNIPFKEEWNQMALLRTAKLRLAA